MSCGRDGAGYACAVRFLTILTITAALVAAGCGDDENRQPSNGSAETPQQVNPGASRLAADDVAQVVEARDSVDTACGLAENQAGSEIPLDQAIATLERIYRNNPEGSITQGFQLTEPISTETLVEQIAKELEGCGKTAEATKLESVL